jgi:hypothetical protein
MKIYAIGDLHLSGKTPKPMGIFGENWEDHHGKIRQSWLETVTGDDLVLIPGDISWAMSLEDALVDLEWVAALPGKKVIIRGNHDYWWESVGKVRAALPPSIIALQNDSVTIDGISIAGTRMWEDPELAFGDSIQWISRESIGLGPQREISSENGRIFQRELGRLSLSLESLSAKTKKIIVMLHYPPTDFEFRQTRTVSILTKFGTDACVYGHLHSQKRDRTPKFPVRKWGIDFHLVSSDFLDFRPARVM